MAEILNRAKSDVTDEFYTFYSDIQAELNHYEYALADRTVLCNCDDPAESEFCRFFLRNFRHLKLKRLICTSYSGSPIVGTQMSLLDDAERPITSAHGYVIDVHDVPVSGRGVTDADIDRLLHSRSRGIKRLSGNGDYKSEECLALMDQADLVVSNPPFSDFRHYLATLYEHHKQFIIIGAINNATYADVFGLMKDNKLWMGYTHPKNFMIPSDNGHGNVKKLPDGTLIASFGNICWYTNIDIPRRHEKLILYRHYRPEDYNHYDNFDAIDIPTLADIPRDYAGLMGVPTVSLMGVYNPDQFEIIGGTKGKLGAEIGVKRNYRGRTDVAYTDENGKRFCPYGRMIVRNREPEPWKE